MGGLWTRPSCKWPVLFHGGNRKLQGWLELAGAGWGGGKQVFPGGDASFGGGGEGAGRSCEIPRMQMDGSVVLPAGVLPPSGYQNLPMVGLRGVIGAGLQTPEMRAACSGDPERVAPWGGT